MLHNVFSFPHPVNEIAARLVAGMVAILTALIILFDAYYLCFLLSYGFLARVMTGPTLSPAGLLATKVLIPALGNPTKLVPGPPKRFAQAIGLIVSSASTLLIFGFDFEFPGEVLLVVLFAFATTESIVGFCFGCFVFGLLMNTGLVPQEVCEKCANWQIIATKENLSS